METTNDAAAAARFAGIDVSKATLDVALRPSGEHWCPTNDEADITELIRRLQPLAPHLIVLEATGGLERLVVAALAPAGLPVAVVNPRQVRDVAQATAGWPRPMHWMRRRWRTSLRPSVPSRARCPMKKAKPSPPWSSGAARWGAC